MGFLNQYGEMWFRINENIEILIYYFLTLIVAYLYAIKYKLKFHYNLKNRFFSIERRIAWL